MNRFSLCILFVLAATALFACSKHTDSAKSEQSQQVTVYMYSEYIDPKLLEDFEKRTGIKVQLDVYEATEDMMAKLQNAGGTSQYDVVVVSDHAIPVLVKQGLIRSLDKKKVMNSRNVDARFSDPPYDHGSQYSVPYQWGTVGIMYRKDKLPQIEPTWGLFFNPAKQPGKFVLIDSMRDMLGAALKFKGFSINTRNQDELKAAGELVLQAKKSVKDLGFEGGVGGKNKIVDGQADLAIVYNGDAIKALEDQKNAEFILPKEGTIIWVDAMTIPSDAPNADAGYKFMNFILESEIGARLSNFNRYATPNAASLPFINKEDRENLAIYPPDDEVKKMEYIADVDRDTKLYDEVWTAVKSR